MIFPREKSTIPYAIRTDLLIQLDAQRQEWITKWQANKHRPMTVSKDGLRRYILNFCRVRRAVWAYSIYHSEFLRKRRLASRRISVSFVPSAP
jgi:hypothetical protein